MFPLSVPESDRHPQDRDYRTGANGAGADCCTLGSGTNSWEGRVNQHPEWLPHEMVPDPDFSRRRSFATRTDCIRDERVFHEGGAGPPSALPPG